MTFTGTERWAEKESHSKGGSNTKAGWRQGPALPSLVEDKETQGAKAAPMGSTPPGRAFYDPIK